MMLESLRSKQEERKWMKDDMVGGAHVVKEDDWSVRSIVAP